MKKYLLPVFIIIAFGLAFCYSGPSGSGTIDSPGIVDELDKTIREASDYLNGRITAGSKVAIISIQSEYPSLSDYVISEFYANTVNDGILTLVDRQQLDVIRAELNFQLSGEVSDQSAQSIGQMLGAQTIITGSIIPMGDLWRLIIRAISVETASVQAQFNRNIPHGATIAALTGIQIRNASSAAAQGGRTGSSVTASGRTIHTETELTEPEKQLVELANKMSSVTGQNAQDSIAQRNAWLNLTAECEAYYQKHLPYEIICDTEIVQDKIDYNRETVDLKFAFMMKPRESSIKVIQEIITGLNKTGKKGEWDLWFWPANLNFFGAGGALVGNGTYFVNTEYVLTSQPDDRKNYIDPNIGGKYYKNNFLGTTGFNTPVTFGKEVEIMVHLLNDSGTVISSTKQTLHYAMGYCELGGGQRSQSRPSLWDFKLSPMAIPEWLYFRGVPASALNDKTSIKIHSLDGVELETASDDYVRISIGKIH